MQRNAGRTLSAPRLLLMLLLIAALGACGEARIVQRDDYVHGNDHRPPPREAARHPLAGRDEYVVVHGDTLYGIAFRNGMDFRELAAINGIQPPYTIYVDQLLRLRGEPLRPQSRPPIAVAPVASNTSAAASSPLHGVRVEPLPDTRAAATATRPAAGATTPVRAAAPSKPTASAGSPPPTAMAKPVAPPASGLAPPAPAPANPIPTRASAAEPSATAIPALSAPVGGIAWRWPAKGRVIERFMAGDATRQGVDIAGNAGDPVSATADGVVVYSGSGLVGYGELIIIKHSDEWLSAYGHNRKRLVQEGQRVQAGQQIAEMGRTGANRDELHFEIRRNGRPVDPQQFLPQR